MTDEIRGPRYFRRHVRRANRRGHRKARREYWRIIRLLKHIRPGKEAWPASGPR